VHGGAHVLDENLQHKLGMRFLDVGTCSALALPWPCDVALREDALTLLHSLPDGCAAVVFFDPQIARCSTSLPTATRGHASVSVARCRR
jgi:hypothetical protein